MIVSELLALLDSVPDGAVVGIFVEGEPQGFSAVTDEGYNTRENIFWLKAERDH